MSRQKLTSTAALIALIAGLAGPVMAQDAAAPQSDTAAADLPAPLAALNLNKLRSETGRDGIREIEGFTADGVEIEVKIDMAGNLIKVEAEDGALPAALIEALLPQAVRDHEATGLFVRIDEIRQHGGFLRIEGRQAGGEDVEAVFDAEGRLIGLELDDAAIPASLVAALLPQPVRDAEAFGQFAGIEEIHNRGGVVVVEGRDEAGEKMKAAFDADGRLLRFGRDEDRGPRQWRGRAPHGEAFRHGRDDMMGMMMKGQGGHGDMRGAPMRPGGPGHQGHGPAGGPRHEAPDFDTAEVNRRLTGAGYGGFGFLRMDGPRILLEADNPQGEPVTLELDPRGEVVRETAR